MAHERKWIGFQLHIDMYPLSRQEQTICDTLFAHVAAVNTINESDTGRQFIHIEDLLPFVEKLLHKNAGTSLTARLVGIHLHICREVLPDKLVPDLAIISYLFSA
jgi:uncharacterized protein YdaL